VDNGQLTHTTYTLGGWVDSGSGWILSDLQIPTAVVQTNSVATGVQTYNANFMASGTEAQGTAWKSAIQSSLSTQGTATVQSVMNAWTVNVKPNNVDSTNFYYSEVTGSNYVSSALTVAGSAFGGSLTTPSAIVSTTYVSSNPITQNKLVIINSQ
jgi:hypothetical protein